MAILCVGSINIDLVYRVPHLVRGGETLAADSFDRGLGGKGANQSIAAAQAGADVAHLGAVGSDGADIVAEMSKLGVDVGQVAMLPDVATGHAVIAVDDAGENAIILHRGANGAIDPNVVMRAAGSLQPGDWLMLQNEVAVSSFAAKAARAAGAHVVYSAAPFDAEAVAEILPNATHLLVNEGENAALMAAGLTLPDGVVRVVTKGSDGVMWLGDGQDISQPAFDVANVVDTTGAGDCFAGNLVAALDRGVRPGDALRIAQAAAAIQITRPGAAPAMPSLSEVTGYLSER